MCAKKTITTQSLTPKSKTSSTTAVLKSAVTERDIKYVLSLSDDEDTKSAILLKICEGFELDKAIRHSRAAAGRDRRWGGITQPRLTKTEKKAGSRVLVPNFIYIDHPKNDQEMSVHEKIAFSEIEKEKSLTKQIDKSSENMLSLVCKGTGAIAKLFGVTQRRAQQKVAEAVAKIENENEFRNGGKGQGGLFDFTFTGE